MEVLVKLHYQGGERSPRIALYTGEAIWVGHIPEPDAVVVWQDDPGLAPGILVHNLCCRLKGVRVERLAADVEQV